MVENSKYFLDFTTTVDSPIVFTRARHSRIRFMVESESSSLIYLTSTPELSFPYIKFLINSEFPRETLIFENETQVRKFPHSSNLSNPGRMFWIDWKEQVTLTLLSNGPIVSHPWNPFGVNFVGFHSG